MRKLVYLTNLKQIGGHFAYIMRDTVESQVHEGYIWLNFVAKHVSSVLQNGGEYRSTDFSHCFKYS
jgi:hypothetical protein